MRDMFFKPICALMIASLAACSDDAPLRDLSTNTEDPEEFAIVPAKPLEIPKDLNALPSPDPMAQDRTALEPKKEALAALGGRPGGARDAGSQALMNHTARYGVTQNIRAELFAEDTEYRRRKGRFTQLKIVPVDRYNRVYAPYTLDARQIAEFYRQKGVPTPSVPPPPR